MNRLLFHTLILPSQRGSSILLTTGWGGGPPVVLMLLYVLQSNFMHYRTLAFKPIMAVEIKQRKREWMDERETKELQVRGRIK